MRQHTQSLEDFYRSKKMNVTEDISNETGQFNIFRIEDHFYAGAKSPTYIRRSFYKIMLYQGNNVIRYADKSIPISGNTLLFFSPKIPYTYDPVTSDSTGYYCVFRDEFFKENFRLNLCELPLFTDSFPPVFALDEQMTREFISIFEKVEREKKSDYTYKFDLIKNYIGELIYMAMKLQPSEMTCLGTNASSRITSVFAELLERQFPIHSVSERFELRSPKAFADKLAVHVNHLNRAIKKTTGRTTSEHISERITGEAKALLKYTDWNISEISYVLGFNDQAHFNYFFKKQVNLNPSIFRQVQI